MENTGNRMLVRNRKGTSVVKGCIMALLITCIILGILGAVFGNMALGNLGAYLGGTLGFLFPILYVLEEIFVYVKKQTAPDSAIWRYIRKDI